MSRGDDITLVLSLDGKDFELGIKGAGRILNRFEGQVGAAKKRVDSLDTSFEGILGSTRDFTIILATAEQAITTLARATFGWQKAIMDAAGEIERLQVMMKGMSSETNAAKRELDALNDSKFVTDFAQNAPFSMQSLTDTFVKFRTVGLEPTDGSMKGLTDAVATFGGNTDILHRASVAIQQMMGKGVISMEELRQQLGEAVPSAMKIMARSMGMSVSELVGAIESGTVASESALKKMLAEMTLSFEGGGVRMMSTWQGILQSLETRWMLFMKDMAGSVDDPDSFFSVVKGMIDEMSQWLVSSEAKAFANELAEGLKVLAGVMRSLLITVYENRDAIVMFAKAFATWYALSRASMLLTALVNSIRQFQLANTGMVKGITEAGKEFRFARANILEASAAIDMATTAKQQNAIAANAMGTSLRAVGRGLLGLLGPLSAVAAIGYTVWSTLSSIRRESEQLVNSVLESQGLLSSSEDLAKIREDRENLLKELEEDREALAKYEERLAVGDRTNESGGFMDDWREKAEELRASINEMEGDLGRLNLSATMIEESLHSRALENAKTAADRRLNNLIDPLRAQFREQRELHEDMLAEANGNLDKIREVNELAVQAADELLEGQLQALKAERDRQEEILNTLDRSSVDDATRNQLAAVEATMEALNQKEREFIRDRDRFVQEYQRVNERIVKPQRGVPEEVKQSQRALQAMEQLVNGFAIRMQQVQAKADEANPHLEGLEERIRQLREQLLPGDVGLFDVLAEQARATATELGNLERLKRREREGEQAYMQMLSRTASAIGDTERGRLARMRVQKIELAEQVRQYEELLEKMKEAGVDPAQVQLYADALTEYHAESMNQIVRDAESSWDVMMRDMREFERDWAGLWKGAADTAIDEIVRFAKEGKLEFGNLVDYVLEQMLRVELQKSLVQPMSELMNIGKFALSGMFGSTSGYTQGFGAQVAATPVTASANGNIMTQWGPAALNRYEKGGIANSPQISIFGEGRTPEAYVPLPDGRSIPVTMQGGGGGAPNIQFNLINQSGQQVEAEQAGGRFDGEAYVLDVVLKAVNRPGSFRDSMKGAIR